MTHTRGTIAIKILVTILVIGLIIFAGYTLYYLWQFKYGDPEIRARIQLQYSDQFSKGIDKEAPSDFPQYREIIHTHNPQIGNPQAPITIIVFIDFECPYCQAQYPVFSYIRDQYGPAINIVFKHTPLTDLHPQSLNAALASSCAAEQQKFWEFHDRLFETKQLGEHALFETATLLKLNSSQFNNCFTTKKYLNDIQEDMNDAARVGVRGTPTMLINGTIVEGVLSQKNWDTLLLSYLKK